jgi:SAM-dependent methyltransferase
MGAPSRTEAWERGEAYEPFIGRWSRPVARLFVAWLGLPAGGRWVDVGCGTGALGGALLEVASPRLVVAFDRSPGFTRYAADRCRGGPAWFVAADACRAPIETGAADAVVSGLMLNFLPEPGAALAEMARLARPGGVVAAYVWDYSGRMDLLRHFWAAAAELDPEAASLDEGRRFPLCTPEGLRREWAAGGMVEIRTTGLEVPTAFADFDDYWRPFLGGQGPAPGYLSSLAPQRQEALRQRLQTRLAPGGDGPIRLVARAWAICGRVPA